MNGYRRNNNRNNNGGVPPRWLRCPRKSLNYIADKFVVFKTPLSKQYDDHVAEEYRFYPEMIIDYVKTTNVREGFYISLSN